jgi:hypothetical protein
MTNTDLGATGQEPRPGNGASGASASPKEMATAAVQTVKQEAAQFADSAKGKARDQVEQKKQTATQTLGGFASAIRKAGDELAQHDQDAAGRMVRQAADSLEDLSRTVGEKRPEELLETVRDFGRRNPTAFIAGSVLLGVAIGRFARSSEQNASGEGGSRSGSTYVRSADFGPSSSLGSQGGALSSSSAGGSGYSSGSSSASGGFDADNGDPAGFADMDEEGNASPQGDLNPMGRGRFDTEA